MRKSALLVALSLGSLLFLSACNTNDNAGEDNLGNDVKNGVNDVMDDTRDVIDDTVDTVDPDTDGRSGQNDMNGQTNESTIDNNHNSNVPNGSNGPNVENGATAPGAPSVNQEDIIEDRADRKDKDEVDNH
ncbi:hypothetical protein B857_00954 [Solibacillus isronensis B3W22]|uniref:Secreted protein n=1 Tax=Solibacillus isronensis B3W22 TaxID=1224748 RepID=K1KPI5_9BACL|nr:hypothetical protein [Solibacillus isronensis]AMO84312.1 hypothetical protein SOLI23_01655 [Solibacillus silvestris]EKB46060.1 hypothetical protein B857_00954 [Solibacillus isronensis B3W22]